MNIIKSDFTIVGRQNGRKSLVDNTKQIIFDLQKRIHVLEMQLKSLNFPKKLKVSTREAMYFINFNDIMYLKSESNYTNLYLRNGKRLLISKTLRVLVNKIDDSSFIRIHASYYINSNYLYQYVKSNNKVILKNGIEIPVSRSKKKLLIDWTNIRENI